MKKSAIQQMPKYFDRYIHLTDDVTFLEALEISIQELIDAPIDKWKALGEKVYAPGKWTIKDILQHYIDTERVFTYRITAIARGDKQMMTPYDEEMFAANALANRRTVDDLYDELLSLRKTTLMMFKSFTEDMLLQEGHGFNDTTYCVLSLAFMLAGHQRWHFKVLQERYYPLLES
ncbi:MAG: DinB family protein [Chitinophagaceae bacterium]|nr:DinB family protein [Chitinophagaceae bacterium]